MIDALDADKPVASSGRAIVKLLIVVIAPAPYRPVAHARSRGLAYPTSGAGLGIARKELRRDHIPDQRYDSRYQMLIDLATRRKQVELLTEAAEPQRRALVRTVPSSSAPTSPASTGPRKEQPEQPAEDEGAPQGG